MQPTKTAPPSASQLIRAAIAAAGKGPEVAKRLGVSTAAVNAWAARGDVPSCRIKPLCEMGSFIVTTDQLLDAISRERQAA